MSAPRAADATMPMPPSVATDSTCHVHGRPPAAPPTVATAASSRDFGSEYGEARLARIAPHAPPTSSASEPLVGMCISGDFRALDRTYASIDRYATRGFGGNHVHFLYLVVPSRDGSESGESACDALACTRGFEPQKKGLGPWSVRAFSARQWPLVNDSCVLSAIDALNPRGDADFFYGHPPSSEALRWCSSGFYRHESALQLLHVQSAFRMLRDYERRWSRRFDWVVRLRTDAMLLAPLPHFSTLPEGAHLVYGMVSVPVNDHTVVVSRAHAPAYFDLADELVCNRSAAPLEDNKLLVLNRLRAHGVPTWTLHMPYVLTRPGVLRGTLHFDCWRLYLRSGGWPPSTNRSAAHGHQHRLPPEFSRTPSNGVYQRYYSQCCDRLGPTYRECADTFRRLEPHRPASAASGARDQETAVDRRCACTRDAAEVPGLMALRPKVSDKIFI